MLYSAPLFYPNGILYSMLVGRLSEGEAGG